MSQTFTCIQWLKKYQEEIAKIKEHSPFLMVLCISAGIELMGKLLSPDDLDDGNGCNGKFEGALKQFDSLKKYKDKDLYHLVRCGLAHRVSVKENIILSKELENDLDASPIVLNTNSFFEDFSKAVDDAQVFTGWAHQAATSDYVSITSDLTGLTPTIINYIEHE